MTCELFNPAGMMLSISFPGGQDRQHLLKRAFLWCDTGSMGLANQAVSNMLAKISIIFKIFTRGKLKFKIFEKILNSNFLKNFFLQQTGYSLSGILVLRYCNLW